MVDVPEMGTDPTDTRNVPKDRRIHFFVSVHVEKKFHFLKGIHY